MTVPLVAMVTQVAQRTVVGPEPYLSIGWTRLQFLAAPTSEGKICSPHTRISVGHDVCCTGLAGDGSGRGGSI